jgi:archaellum component FlaF (FlaF/FlaG flagellin family)
MGASVGVGGLIVGTSMLVVLALAVNAIDLRMETSLETIESASEPPSSFTIDNADIALGAVTTLQIDNAGTGYSDGTLSTLEPGDFAGTYTVNSSGAIISWSITNHGDYSSDPTIVIDNVPPGASNGALSVVSRTTVIDVTFTNTGTTIVPVDEVWLFLDGNTPTKLSALAPSVDSDFIYSGDIVTVEWRGLGNDSFDDLAITVDGYSVTRALI